MTGVQTCALPISYPCIWYKIDADINNVGTIPVIIQSITVTSLPSYAEYHLTGAKVGDEIEQPGSLIGPDTVHFDIEIHLLNSPMTPMSASFTFTVTIQCVQYNEFTPPP